MSVLLLLLIWPAVVAFVSPTTTGQKNKPNYYYYSHAHASAVRSSTRGQHVVVRGALFEAGRRGRGYERMALELDDDGCALALAAEQDDWDAVDWLVRQRASADGRYKGKTALHYAIATGEHSIIRSLLAAAADPNAKNDLGQTPLLALLAKLQQQPDNRYPATELLRELQRTFKSEKQNSQLDDDDESEERLCADIIALSLLEAGADPDAGNPLKIAVAQGRMRFVELLVCYGASPDDTLRAAMRKGDYPTALAVAEPTSLDDIKMAIRAERLKRFIIGIITAVDDTVGPYIIPELGAVYLYVLIILLFLFRA